MGPALSPMLQRLQGESQQRVCSQLVRLVFSASEHLLSLFLSALLPSQPLIVLLVLNSYGTKSFGSLFLAFSVLYVSSLMFALFHPVSPCTRSLLQRETLRLSTLLLYPPSWHLNILLSISSRSRPLSLSHRHSARPQLHHPLREGSGLTTDPNSRLTHSPSLYAGGGPHCWPRRGVRLKSAGEGDGRGTSTGFPFSHTLASFLSHIDFLFSHTLTSLSLTHRVSCLPHTLAHVCVPE